MKKFLFVCLLVPTISLAETCPTPCDLQSTQLKGWDAYDINSGLPVAPLALKAVNQFALAEWMKDAPEGEAHCYYYTAEQPSEYFRVYLAKHHLTFKNTPNWFPMGVDTRQCDTSISACEFLDAIK